MIKMIKTWLLSKETEKEPVKDIKQMYEIRKERVKAWIAEGRTELPIVFNLESGNSFDPTKSLIYYSENDIREFVDYSVAFAELLHEKEIADKQKEEDRLFDRLEQVLIKVLTSKGEVK